MRFLLFLLVCLTFSGAAWALRIAPIDKDRLPTQAPDAYSQYICSPAEFSFAEAPEGWLIDGRLATPTPGYHYRIEMDGTEGNVIQARLILTAPDGPALTVIDHINIRHFFPRLAGITGLNMTFEKGFNWGPSAITCQQRS